jgi:hypothetical protein
MIPASFFIRISGIMLGNVLVVKMANHYQSAVLRVS